MVELGLANKEALGCRSAWPLSSRPLFWPLIRTVGLHAKPVCCNLVVGIQRREDWRAVIVERRQSAFMAELAHSCVRARARHSDADP